MEEILAGPTALLTFLTLIAELLRKLWSALRSAKEVVKSRRVSQNDSSEANAQPSQADEPSQNDTNSQPCAD